MVKKKKVSRILPKKQKSRAKYQCPQELENLIDDVKAVKSGVPLKYRNEREDELFPPQVIGNNEIKLPNVAYSMEFFERFFLGFDEQFKTELLEKAKLHIAKTKPGIAERNILHTAIAQTILWYNVIVSKHTVLLSIAKFFAELRKGDCRTEGENKILPKDGEPLYLPTINNQISRTGTIGKLDLGFAAAFHNVNLDRIRLCQICSRIFWAKREESETCSKPCFNNLRVRRYRTLSPEEKAKRKAQREANKRYKRTLQKKEENNGTV